MQAVILAGGLGTRLRPVTRTRPKALVPLLNRPMVLHVLDALPATVDEVVIAASYMIEALEAFFADHVGPPGVTIVEEREPLGTGGALKNLEGTLRDTFVALNGDVISSVDVDRLVDYHRAKGGVGTLALWEEEDPAAYGVVGTNPNGRVERFVEKPSGQEAFSPWINAGTYVFEEEVLDLVPAHRPVSLEREVFPLALERGLYGMPFEGHWADAGTLEHYLEATCILLDLREAGIGETEEGAREGGVVPPVLLGPQTVVEGGRVGPYVSLGAGCRLTEARVSRSVLLEDVRVEPGARIEDSLVGSHAVIGRAAHLRACIVGDGALVGGRSELLDKRVSA